MYIQEIINLNFIMVDNELYRITGKVYKELAELCDKYGKCQINCGKSR